LSRVKELKIFSGTAHPNFTEEIAKELNVQVSGAKHFRFSDGEIGYSVDDSIRGADVYIVQPTCYPVNENLMELLIMADAMKRASTKRITAVIPYFGYARQDRKTKSREPITAKLVSDIIARSGVDRVITADLHSGQIQGFFDIPVDNLTGINLLADYFIKELKEELSKNKVIVVSPDVGGVARARKFAVKLGTDLAIIDKRRSYEIANVCEVMNIVGDVKDKICILVDDIIDTSGTICNAGKSLMDNGATKAFACATHAVLSGPALTRINNSEIEKFIFSDTIPPKVKCDKLCYLSIAPLFAKAIMRLHRERPLEDLF